MTTTVNDPTESLDEPTAVPEKTATQVLADVSIEYSMAIAEIQYLLPQYTAAVERYTKARRAMKDFIDDQDSEINLY